MDFHLSEEQISIKDMVRQFAENEILPHADQWDLEHTFPKETLRLAAQLGLAAINVRPEVNGSQLSRLDGAVIFEELATACPSTAAYLSIHNMVTSLIDRFANDLLRQKWVPLLANLTYFSSYCLTEPSSGSDAASLKTTAVKEGDVYIVNGAKAFISGGHESDVYICMVRTGEEGANGISCLLIERNTPGLTFGKPEQKLGWHSQPTTMVFFENCRVPTAHLIGKEGQGFKIALSALNGGRINIAACSLGGAKKCLQLTHQYMHQREQFGQKLRDFEALQFKYADMLTDYEAAKLMVYRAAWALDNQHANAPMYCAMAKRFATDLCFAICNSALQLHGGYGYIRDYSIERYFRDLRVHQILEGTNEIMRLIIARQALQESFVL